MKLLIGIGNPGNRYHMNRHNAGILFIEWLTKKKKINPSKITNKYVLYPVGQYKNLTIDLQEKLLCISQEYMNLSGKSVQPIKKKYPLLKPENIMVVHDDLQHKLGNVRVKDGGSSQGHNGLQSICSSLKSKNIKKLQLGIGRPNSREPQVVAKYVLTNFSSSQYEILTKSFDKALELATKYEFI